MSSARITYSTYSIHCHKFVNSTCQMLLLYVSNRVQVNVKLLFQLQHTLTKLLKENTDCVCDYFITSKFISQIDWRVGKTVGIQDNSAVLTMLHSLLGVTLQIVLTFLWNESQPVENAEFYRHCGFSIKYTCMLLMGHQFCIFCYQ